MRDSTGGVTHPNLHVIASIALFECFRQCASHPKREFSSTLPPICVLEDAVLEGETDEGPTNSLALSRGGIPS